MFWHCHGLPFPILGSSCCYAVRYCVSKSSWHCCLILLQEIELVRVLAPGKSHVFRNSRLEHKRVALAQWRLLDCALNHFGCPFVSHFVGKGIQICPVIRLLYKNSGNRLCLHLSLKVGDMNSNPKWLMCCHNT